MPFSLALQRNEVYIKDMSLPMRNLMGIRYYLLPLEQAPADAPSPFDDSQPKDGLTLELLGTAPGIPPTRAYSLRVVSYTHQTTGLPNGFLAGEIDLTLNDATHRVLPLRLGMETSDWAYDGVGRVASLRHAKARETLDFPAYLRAVGTDFKGIKSVAQLEIPSLDAQSRVTAIGVHSFLPASGLVVEHIELIDDHDTSVSLSRLLHRNDLTLAFRSDTAAMWENRDVMPRAFVVPMTETVNDSQALEKIRSPEFDPYQNVLLSDAPPNDPVSNLPDAVASQRRLFGAHRFMVPGLGCHSRSSLGTHLAGRLYLSCPAYPAGRAPG
jgi:hypothetical protein